MALANNNWAGGRQKAHRRRPPPIKMAGAIARQPQYLQLAHALEREIGRGRPAVGGLLPTESELCRAHGVSRHTVRAALRYISDLGLVSRRQGSGTQVIASAARPSYTQSIASIADLMQYAKDTYLELGPRRAVPTVRWRACWTARRADGG